MNGEKKKIIECKYIGRTVKINIKKSYYSSQLGLLNKDRGSLKG